MSAPQSTVDLYRCNLNPNGLFTCDFSYGEISENGYTGSAASRDNYFANPDNTLATKYGNSITNCTFVRKDMTITIPANADTLNYNGVNYCRFKNPRGEGYGSMWTYAFITKIEYVAEQTTRLHIATDIFTTYIGDIVRKDCMVEREHVYNDTAFKHTLPEPTPSFEQVNVKNHTIMNYNGKTPAEQDEFFWIGVYCNEGSGIPGSVPKSRIGHVPGTGYMFCCELQYLAGMLAVIQSNYQAQVIYTIMLPKTSVWVEEIDEYDPGHTNFYIAQDVDGDDLKITIEGIKELTSIDYKPYGDWGSDSHTIRNKKLNCFPYSSVEITDGWNQSCILKPELMISEDFYFHVEAGSSPTATVYYKEYAQTYQRIADFSNSVSLTDFPPIPYDVNYFTEYLAQHKNQIEVQRTKDMVDLGKGFAKAAVGVGTAVATGGASTLLSAGMTAAGAAGDLYGPVMNMMERNAMYSDMKQRPPKTYNAPDGNTKLGTNSLNLYVVRWAPSKEYIELLDMYFDMYGYNVCMVKTPCWNTRRNWNYVKTVGANFGGTIPAEDKGKLNKLFDSGITIWHFPGEYGSFSAPNLAPIR